VLVIGNDPDLLPRLLDNRFFVKRVPFGGKDAASETIEE
jgi:hypothetical protein